MALIHLCLLLLLASAVLVFGKGQSLAATFVESSSDLWDMSQGNVVTADSGVLGPPVYNSSYASDIRDMFGGSYGLVEPGHTLFQTLSRQEPLIGSSGRRQAP